MKKFYLSNNYYLFMAEVGVISTALAVIIHSIIPIASIFVVSLLVLNKEVKGLEEELESKEDTK